jgi:hypothetical protein
MTTQRIDPLETRVRLPGVSGAHSWVVVRLSPHAAARYHERVRPSLDAGAAAREGIRLISEAVLDTEPPAWLRPTGKRSPFYIRVGDLAMPVEWDSQAPDRLVVSTVLPRGMGSQSRGSRARARRFTKAAERRERRDQRAQLDVRRRRRSRRRAARRSTTLRNSRRWA